MSTRVNNIDKEQEEDVHIIATSESKRVLMTKSDLRQHENELGTLENLNVFAINRSLRKNIIGMNSP